MGTALEYIRESSKTKVKKRYRAARHYCKIHNLELVKNLKDLGLSGNTCDKDGLAQLTAFYNGIPELKTLMTSSLMDMGHF